jgi:hypothetical protein
MPCRNNRVCMEKMMADQRKPQRDAAWITAGGVAIAGDAILLDLKLGADNGFLDALIWRKAAASVAAKRGVSLSDDDLVEALDSFHADRDLFEPEQIDHWYETRRLDRQAVREHVAEATLVERARQESITDDQIQKRFAADRYEYARAEADVFQFKTIGEAKEFMLAVREHELTPQGGTRTMLTRREAPEEIAATLLSVDRGELTGPVETDESTYAVYLLIRREEAILDDSLREEIRDKLFDELVETELTRDPLTFVA